MTIVIGLISLIGFLIILSAATIVFYQTFSIIGNIILGERKMIFRKTISILICSSITIIGTFEYKGLQKKYQITSEEPKQDNQLRHITMPYIPHH